MASDYWLYRWMDEYEVRSETDFTKLVKSPAAPSLSRLQELAAEDAEASVLPYSGPGTAILAGKGLDLSAELGCRHRECQVEQIDALFSRVLHYFDEIVIAGPPSKAYLRDVSEDLLYALREDVATLLHLREIGVEDMLLFRRKPAACTVHYERHAHEAGLEGLLERKGDWIDRLVELGSVEELHQHDDHWHFHFSHPHLEHTFQHVVGTPSHGGEPTPQDFAESVLALYVAQLVSDLGASRNFGLPLGSAIRMHEDVLSDEGRPVAEDDVAFNIQLPVLAALAPSEVIRIRQDEYEAFLAFRESLKVAIRERIQAGEAPKETVTKIQTEHIQPALVDIANRLRSAERSFTRKASLSVAVGGLMTTVGVLSASPLLLDAGVAATAASPLVAAHKYFEERGSIEVSDMYFLWRLHREAKSHVLA